MHARNLKNSSSSIRPWWKLIIPEGLWDNLPLIVLFKNLLLCVFGYLRELQSKKTTNSIKVIEHESPRRQEIDIDNSRGVYTLKKTLS
jgi:hypothetical protein